MKSPIIISIIALLSCFAACLPAQEKAGDPYDISNLRLEFLRVENPAQFFSTVHQLYGRSIELRENGQRRFVENLMILGDNILVHDTPENVKRIVEGIQRIIRETKADKLVAPKMVQKEIRPEYISLHDAVSALGSLARRKSESKGFTGYENITVVEASGLLIIQDSVENVDRMVRILSIVDVPQQQVLIRCRIIQGDEKVENPDPRLAKLLPPELKELTPFENFKVLAAGAIRSSATNGRPINMEMSGANDISASLGINPGGYSPETQTLILGSLTLNYRGPIVEPDLAQNKAVTHIGPMRRESQNLQTSTTLPAGEVVVIGALGDNPIFVILEMTPIKN